MSESWGPGAPGNVVLVTGAAGAPAEPTVDGALVSNGTYRRMLGEMDGALA